MTVMRGPARANITVLFQINWKQFLKSIFEGIVNIDVHVDGQDSTIIVSHLEYMKSIFKLLAETPPQVIGTLGSKKKGHR